MTTARWANIGHDPGALHAIVDSMASSIPVASIDRVWIFPARRVPAGDSVVIVISVFDEDEARRSVRTARFTVSRDRRGAATVSSRYDEHGSAPVEAVARVVQGVLRRLGEDSEASPREESIDGEQDRWDALVVDLGAPPRRQAAEADEVGAADEEDGVDEAE